MKAEFSPEDINEEIGSRYIQVLAPLFFPEDPVGPDIVKYFASLLRIVGMEDKGWDPYIESRAVVNDIYALIQGEFPSDKFPDGELTKWRLGLILYTHIIEMDATYEVILNLLRFRLGYGYNPNPFFDFLTEKQKKNFRKNGTFPKQKIEIIKKLSDEAKIDVGGILSEFYRSDLRNAISHSDFIFSDDGFRCRAAHGIGAFNITFAELDAILTKAKVFVGRSLVWNVKPAGCGVSTQGEVLPMIYHIKA